MNDIVVPADANLRLERIRALDATHACRSAAQVQLPLAAYPEPGTLLRCSAASPVKAR